MEDRIKKLEDFQGKWKFYFWCAVVIASLASIFFGFQMSSALAQTKKLSTELSAKEGEVNELQKRIEAITSLAERAYHRAGDLEFAVNETKKAVTKANESAETAARASTASNDASQQALQASQKSEAISKTLDDKLRNVEVLLAEMKNLLERPKKEIALNEDAPLKELLVQVNGSSMDITFEEGSTPYSKIELKQSFYEGIVYVPEGYIAIVTGYCTFSDFTINEQLKGRVVDNLEGSSNKWKIHK
jgi:hypothetical protein